MFKIICLDSLLSYMLNLIMMKIILLEGNIGGLVLS